MIGVMQGVRALVELLDHDCSLITASCMQCGWEDGVGGRPEGWYTQFTWTLEG